MKVGNRIFLISVIMLFMLVTTKLTVFFLFTDRDEKNFKSILLGLI